MNTPCLIFPFIHSRYIRLNQTAWDDVSVTDAERKDFEALFSSRAFEAVKHVTLRNTQLNSKDLKRLAKFFPELQILIIDSPHGHYVE